MQLDDDKLLAAVRQAGAAGLGLTDLASKFRLDGPQSGQLRKRMTGLVRAGTLRRLGRDRWSVPPELRPSEPERAAPPPRAERDGPHAVGRIRVHPAGYGFVERDDGSEDVFVPAKYRGAALDGDKV